ncbi:uncharacterized protein LOC122651369 [Telopea speciosissima]|uniref:uncharacterized protein LOC122651369 n=1 Tax=Telopea speciosissima TaxID=54955 RepID=UPI001CC6098E|nr:uncharacterized protein LOC122651369 [Telopea speciosissima]
MAGTSTFPPPMTGSTPVEVPRINGVGPLLHRIGASLMPLRIATKSNGVFACSSRSSCSNLALAEGPSCIFVGPIETASKETLEALYRQARDAYYSGKPLIVDDMFDKVELKLRWYGSKSVVKYPRCSLRRQSTYADAEEDHSQVLALASVWTLILAFGGLAFLVPTIYTVGRAYQDAFTSKFLSSSSSSTLEFLSMVNGILLMALGSLIGYPIASASVRALQGLWRNNLVALKGPCPNCTEEVYAFVRADQFNQVPHRADCHVCQCTLEFRTKVEKSISRPSGRWVYGRIYLVPGRGANCHQRWM